MIRSPIILAKIFVKRGAVLPIGLLVCLCIIDVGFHLPLLAQTATVSLSLKEAIDRAQANNPQLLAAIRSIPVALTGLEIAQNSPNPRLSFDYPFGRAETKRTLSIEQPLELGGKRQARQTVALDQLLQSQWQVDVMRWKLRTDVRQAYAELAIAEAARIMSEQTLAINQQLVDIAKKRLAAGDVAEVDVIQSNLTKEGARSKLETVINRVHQATISLNALLGQPTETTLNLVDGKLFNSSGSLVSQVQQKLPTLEALKQLAQASRMDLALARLQIRLDNDQIALARSAQVPDITLAGSFISDPSINATGITLGVRMDLPLRNNHQGEVKQANANYSQAQAQLNSLELQVNTEVTKAYQDVVSTQSLIIRDRTISLPQALELLNLSRKSYQYGQTGLTDVLVVQQTVQAQLDAFYSDILAYQTAIGALEQAVNQPVLTMDNTNVPKTP